MIRLYLWFYRVLFVAREPWVRWAPGLPCALCYFGGDDEMHQLGARSSPASADVHPDLIPAV
jgi:hypothetical protein